MAKKKNVYSPADVRKISGLSKLKGEEKTKRITALAKEFGVAESTIISKYYSIRLKKVNKNKKSETGKKSYIELKEKLQIDMRLRVSNIRLENTSRGMELVFTVNPEA